MNLKTKQGGFLCVDCGCPIEVNNAMTLRYLEMGKAVKCPDCLRQNQNGQRYSTYQEYLQSYEWQQKTDECKRRAGKRCQICNSPYSLESHHRKYGTWGDESVKDLLCVCRGCHAVITEHVNLFVD